jgi:hypothetical protein
MKRNEQQNFSVTRTQYAIPQIKDDTTPKEHTANNISLDSIKISAGPDMSGLSDNDPRLE